MQKFYIWYFYPQKSRFRFCIFYERYVVVRKSYCMNCTCYLWPVRKWEDLLSLTSVNWFYNCEFCMFVVVMEACSYLLSTTGSCHCDTAQDGIHIAGMTPPPKEMNKKHKYIFLAVLKIVCVLLCSFKENCVET